MMKINKLSAFAMLKNAKQKKDSNKPLEQTKIANEAQGKNQSKSPKPSTSNQNQTSELNNSYMNGNNNQKSTSKRKFETVEIRNEKRMKKKKKMKEKRHKQIDLLEKLNVIHEINDLKQKNKLKKRKKHLNEQNIQDDYKKEAQNGPEILNQITKMKSNQTDSRLQGQKCFDWLIAPMKKEKFFPEFWEKKPLLVQRKNSKYYDGIFSCSDFDKILKENFVQFTKNIDITSYENGQRKTLNPDGRAYAPVVWDHYQNGCSVRLLNPQTFSRSVWKLNSLLQEYFGCFVGANVYLTPSGSQGFAPHYDDIEAFVIQLEGKKTWSVYSPIDDANTLPRFSSKNLDRKELKTRPIISIELEAGDMLYFPRGFVHEAKTNEKEHSLHITLSCYQRNTWGDLLERLVPRALQIAIEEDIEFRKGLPLNYLQYMGVANEDMQNSDRESFLKKILQLMSKLVSYVPVDSGVDQMAKSFIHDYLPPYLTQRETLSSIHTTEKMWKNNSVDYTIELEPDTKIKLIRYHAVRLVMEDETVKLYHSVENSREYHEYEPQYIDIGAELAPAIELLLNSYPDYTSIEELPLDTLDQKMTISNLLYDKGLITIIKAEEYS